MRKNGFTLIELSIVLVIIGLIVGGVLVGQDLIKAAQLRKVVTEVESYKTAVNAFRLKYNCFPGDCDNATTFFSGSTNGNGDKQILTVENYYFWEQLGLAGLIEGSYTGAQGPIGVWDHVIGTNVPGSAVNGVGYWITYRANNSGWGNYYNTFHGNHFTLAADSGSSGPSYLYDPANSFTQPDAFAIDSKVDDGKPATGAVMTNWAHNCTDSASSSDFTGDYRVNLDTKACFMVFPRIFQ